MKKVFLLVFTALAALMAASCQKEEMGRVLTATIEQYEHNSKDGNDASKAYINNDYYACWENGDTVSINGIKYPISISQGNDHNYSASIQGTEGLEGDLFAYYPASQVTNLTATGGTVTLPQVQTYRESNGHQIIDNPMAAYCPEGSDELKFRNLAALLKVTIQAPSSKDLTVGAIQVKGDDGQSLWGTAQLILNNQNLPMLDKINDGTASVFLVFDNLETISANTSKSFYIVVPAGSDFFDFTILVASDQGVYQKENKLGQSLQRNHIGALTYAPVENDKVNNAIFYTGSVEGFSQGAFGDAQVQSYDGGIILFDQSITTIGNSAFKNCSSLTRIFLPAGVTSIGSDAFQGCSSLTCITLPAGVTSIGERAFVRCSSLTGISLPTNLSSIGESAFWSCHSLTCITLPAGVTSIGTNVFFDCRSLASITLHERVTSIGNGAFISCRSLTSISLPAGVTSIGNMAFQSCSSLSSIPLPDSLSSIGIQAFWYCSSLESISLPAGVTSIGDYVFSGCTSLTTVYVNRWVDGGTPEITQGDSNMFKECHSSLKIYVPTAAEEAYKTAYGWSNYAEKIEAMPAAQ